jgi:hypothetical protein
MHSPRRRWVETLAPGAAVALLVLWAVWWVASLARGHLIAGDVTWVSPLPEIAADFRFSIDHVARVRSQGRNPYLESADIFCALSPYPPMLYRLVGWVTLLDPATAVWVWSATLAAVLVAGATAARSGRRALRLTVPTWPVMVVAVVFSTPALLALERGQCDPFVIAALLAAAWLLNGRGLTAEVVAGGLLGVVAWVKYYPGVALVGLLALRRGRGALAFVLVAGLIGLVDRDDVRRSIANGATLARANRVEYVAFCFPTKHAIAESWRPLWTATPLRTLRRVPGPVAAALCLVPAVALVSLRVARAADPGPLVVPYLLWLTAAATFGMPYAIDYNLVALPLAALCVWDRRDPTAVHVALGLLLLWWQPIALPIDGRLLFLFKLAGLYAVGASLARKARAAAVSTSLDRGEILRRAA